MNASSPIPRSPELMSRLDTALLIIDVQSKLIRHILDKERLLWNCGRLLDAAALLDVKVLASEQYPQGLGGSVKELAGRFSKVVTKTMFSCRGAADFFESIRAAGTNKVLLAGMEAHVCIQQTAFDLMAEGFSVYLTVDAIGARNAVDYAYAMKRMESAGAVLTTTEAAIFEWCEDSRDPAFKSISQLIQQTPPHPQ